MIEVHDRSPIASVELYLMGGGAGFEPTAPMDTVFRATYFVSLAGLTGRTFSLGVRAVDALDHQTVTPTVTVSVR